MKPSILVTGAYGGMGKATVKALIDKGFRVFALDKTAGKSEKNVFPVQADITDEQSVKDAFNQISKITDKLFAIVHFAGIYMLDSLVEMKTEDFQRVFSINVEGAFIVNKTFMPMLRKGSKILITTSELAPLDPLPFTGIYAVTKAALDKYAYSLAMELQLLGVQVSVLRAGAVSTNMLGVSTAALDKFCSTTGLYKCNADRFKRIVDNVEARSITTEKIAKKAAKILSKKSPKFTYSINRNPLLLLLNTLPKILQLWIIKQVLKSK